MESRISVEDRNHLYKHKNIDSWNPSLNAWSPYVGVCRLLDYLSARSVCLLVCMYIRPSSRRSSGWSGAVREPRVNARRGPDSLPSRALAWWRTEDWTWTTHSHGVSAKDRSHRALHIVLCRYTPNRNASAKTIYHAFTSLLISHPEGRVHHPLNQTT